MQGQAQQQAYNHGITISLSDGQFYQVEYTREVVKRGTASISVRAPEGVTLTADKHSRPPLMEPTSVEKIHKADNHIGIMSVGHATNARQLVDFARHQLQVNHLRYDEPIGIGMLTKEVTDHIQQYTQVSGVHSLDVALLTGGVENGTPRLYETDPSGTSYEWKVVSIGASHGDHQEHLEGNFRDDLALDKGIELALEAIASTSNEGTVPDGVGVTTVPVETECFVELSNGETENYLETNSLLTAEDDRQTKE